MLLELAQDPYPYQSCITHPPNTPPGKFTHKPPPFSNLGEASPWQPNIVSHSDGDCVEVTSHELGGNLCCVISIWSDRFTEWLRDACQRTVDVNIPLSVYPGVVKSRKCNGVIDCLSSAVGCVALLCRKPVLGGLELYSRFHITGIIYKHNVGYYSVISRIFVGARVEFASASMWSVWLLLLLGELFHALRLPCYKYIIHNPDTHRPASCR